MQRWHVYLETFHLLTRIYTPPDTSDAWLHSLVWTQMRKSNLEIWEKNCVHNFLVGTILGPAAVAWKRWLCMRRRAVILIIIGMPVLSIICSDVTRLQCEIPGPDYRVIISGRYQSLGETWSWSASITPPAFPIGFAQFGHAGNRLSASDPLQKTLRVGIKRFW